jgi:hypothetical protein
MPWLPILPLLALAAGHAAEENEAEKLFRRMEQKVRAAATLQLRLDLRLTDALGRAGSVQGALTLGAGDKYRAEFEGKLFGQSIKGTEVSDGARTSFRDAHDPKRNGSEPAPKAAGAYLRGTLPRWGVFLATLNLRRSGELTPDALQLSDFQLVGPEKVGGRNARVIRYTLREKGAKDPLAVRLWLDAETGLPLKLAVTGGKSDWRDLTETYAEFQPDAQVDPARFELPK